MQVSLALKEVSEKALDEILRVGRSITATTDEAVERRPVIATESGESSVRGASGHLAVVPASADNTPVRRPKGSSALPQRAWGRFHRSKDLNELRIAQEYLARITTAASGKRTTLIFRSPGHY